MLRRLSRQSSAAHVLGMVAVSLIAALGRLKQEAQKFKVLSLMSCCGMIFWCTVKMCLCLRCLPIDIIKS